MHGASQHTSTTGTKKPRNAARRVCVCVAVGGWVSVSVCVCGTEETGGTQVERDSSSDDPPPPPPPSRPSCRTREVNQEILRSDGPLPLPLPLQSPGPTRLDAVQGK